MLNFNNKKVAVIICSRKDSKRVPGKIFKLIAGVPVIWHILNRINKKCFPIIFAVPFGEYAEYKKYIFDNDILIFEGDRESPLHRMADAIRWYEAQAGKLDYIVRITHDDLIIDHQSMTELVDAVVKEKAGYGITPAIIEGAGVEVIARDNIIHAASNIKIPVEHISYFVKGENALNKEILLMEPRKNVTRDYRMCLDYEEDAVVLHNIFTRMGTDASVDSICDYLDNQAHILEYNQLPGVSIYTCAYNSERWITATMLSVLANRDIEYTIVDDCSVDGTVEKIITYARKEDNLNITINPTNIGLASSSNIALANCKSRYVMRVDADDKIIPGAIEKMRDRMEDLGAAIIYAAYNEMDENGNMIKKNCDPRKHHHAGCALMDMKAINSIRFTDGLRHWDSLDLYKRVKDKFKIGYVDEPIWFYRRHKYSMSNTDFKKRRMLKP